MCGIQLRRNSAVGSGCAVASMASSTRSPFVALVDHLLVMALTIPEVIASPPARLRSPGTALLEQTPTPTGLTDEADVGCA